MKPFRLLTTTPTYGIYEFRKIVDKLSLIVTRTHYFGYINRLIYHTTWGDFIITDIFKPSESTYIYSWDGILNKNYISETLYLNQPIRILFTPKIGQQFYVVISKKYDPILEKFSDNFTFDASFSIPRLTDITFERYLGSNYIESSRIEHAYFL